MILAIRIPLVLWSLGAASFPQDDAREQFETHVRPVLIEQCYPCHNSHGKAEGGLTLDHRGGARSPSSFGTAVVPGRPGESLLLSVVRHEIPGLEMPDGSPKLSDEVIANLEAWIEDGAFDPRDAPPSVEELEAATGWPAVLEKRKQWWCFQPIRDPDPPPATAWSDHPIDRFVQAKLSAAGLEPSALADPRALLRRSSFVLTGLPPSRDQIARFLEDENPGAFDRLIDRLLASPEYGERFARHWMDVIRYAESHGSEGDPDIPYSYRYRDYLIRAFVRDVPYDQLVREHIAGDLLEEPRIDEQLGIVESKLGTAHWRMVFHGFAPTDALEEKVRYTDDQINVFSKAFLGLTVSCARCHDHKFDAISQKDHAALFSILGSTRPAILDVSTPESQSRHQRELRDRKRAIREAMAEVWSRDATLGDRLRHIVMDLPAAQPSHALSLLAEAKAAGDGESFAETWQRIEAIWREEQGALEEDRRQPDVRRWKAVSDAGEWFAMGNGLEGDASGAGDFAIAPDGERVLTGIYPASRITHGLSTRHRGVLATPRVQLEDELEVWMRIAGGGRASARFVVQGYPRIGTVYPMEEIREPRWYWHRYDLSYWKGDSIHLELATAKDAPVEVRDADRSWFAVRDVILRPRGYPAPPPEDRAHWAPVMGVTLSPRSFEELETIWVEQLAIAIAAWRRGEASDAQALWLDALQRDGVLPVTLSEMPSVAPLIEEYRHLEAQVPLPIRSPGLAEGVGVDAPLFIRGDHERPGDPVPRRFLEAIDETAYDTPISGRLELADDLLREDNPLTARVIVNRIWHWLFGQGLVATPDNFGRLGELPSHPELLDHLASHFRRNGWSIRGLIRYIMTSKTWQQGSEASEQARALDPENVWLSHASVRRLDAEALRDALLAVSGELDPRCFGPPEPANSRSRRRSIYLAVKRNALDELLQTFDAPVPFSATGRRSRTNVPAQSLTLLNDPFILELADRFGALAAGRIEKDRDRLVTMFETALARRPESGEVEALADYLAECRSALARDGLRRREIDEELTAASFAIESILEPVRERLLEGRLAAGDRAGPSPIARWPFDGDLRDTIGDLHGAARGTARLEKGSLVLDGQGHVATAPLDRELRAKTLEAWVQLDGLDQRGGGVMTVQDLAGNVFDAIAFGERDARHWLAGSDFFKRTQFLKGTEETAAAERPVHIAIVWSEDGTVQAYREGQPYGVSYGSGGPVTFAARGSQVLFGLRHGQPGGNRLLQGRLFEARLYDRALTTEEVAESARCSAFVSERAVRKALTDETRQHLMELEWRREELVAEQAAMGAAPSASEAWARVAHLLFNLKEFSYLR
ncbi:MAG: DUF1553 domain-containing protein [Planctomycetota bacterium]